MGLFGQKCPIAPPQTKFMATPLCEFVITVIIITEFNCRRGILRTVTVMSVELRLMLKMLS
jgi:hypothetical protein